MKLRAALTVTALASALTATAVAMPVAASASADASAPAVTVLRSDEGSAPGPMLVEHLNAAVTPPTILSPVAGSTIGQSRPTIQGVADAAALITVTIDGVEEGSTTAGDDGSWAFAVTEPLGNDTYVVSATATNADGEVSAASSEVEFTVDTVAPGRPTVTSPTAGETITVPRPTFTGRGEPGASILVGIDGTNIGKTTVRPDGAWSFVPGSDLRNGARQLSFRAQDDAGNLGLVRNVSVTVQVQAQAPVITSPAAGSVTVDALPMFRGTATPNCTVALHIDGTPVGTTTAADDGAWELPTTSALGIGVHTAAASCTNPSGGVSELSALTTFTVELPAIQPPAPGDPAEEPMESPEIGSAAPDTTVESSVGTPQTAPESLATTGGALPAMGITAAAVALAAGGGLALFTRRRRLAATQTAPAIAE